MAGMRTPAFVMPRVAAIAFGPEKERPRNLATLTGVTIAGGFFLVTAKHVVDCAAAQQFPWRMLLPGRDREERFVEGFALLPEVFPLSRTDILWKSPSSDVAILKAPSGLKMESFDGDRAVYLARQCRETWDVAATHDAYRMVAVAGFPSFARDLGPERPLYGLMSLPGFIVHANKTDAAGVSEPKLTLNLGCETLRPDWMSKPEAATFARQLEEDVEGRALAGLSGGPVVSVTDAGLQLVGILYEGTRVLATGLAVPWDVIHTAFSDSLGLTLSGASR